MIYYLVTLEYPYDKVKPAVFDLMARAYGAHQGRRRLVRSSGRGIIGMVDYEFDNWGSASSFVEDVKELGIPSLYVGEVSSFTRG